MPSETDCDETAAAVVRLTDDGHGEILADRVLSQIEQHRPFGGIVPEVAARAHLECADAIVKAAMDDAGLGFDEIDAYMLLSQAGRMRLGNMVDPKYTMGASILKNYLKA